MEKINILHIGGHHSIHVTDIVTALSKSDIVGEQVLFGYYKATVPNFTSYNYSYVGKYGSPVTLIQKTNQIITDHKIDIVILHSLYNTASVFPAIKLPSILVPWNVPDKNNKKFTTQWKYERAVLEGVDAILFPNAKGIAGIKAHYNITKKLNAVKFHTLISCIIGERSPSPIVRIVSGRTLCKNYRQSSLLSILDRLKKENIKDFSFLFLSGQPAAVQPAYVKEFKSKLNKLQMPNVTLQESALPKCDFIETIRNNDIFVSLTTHDGGYAGTNFMVLASGGILIAPKSNSLWMDIQNGINYIAFEDGSEDDLYTQILYAINNKEQLQNLFVKNNSHFKTYDSSFTIPEMERTIVRCLNKTIN